jgi:CRISPR-associated protein (TIGR02710 family)
MDTRAGETEAGARERPTLLIATVGGTAEPVVASVLHCRPARVLFLCSRESLRSLHSRDVEQMGVLPLLEANGWRMPEGMYETVVFPEAQDLMALVKQIRREVSPEVARWHNRGERYRMVVDFTGGTKCMSVAVGLFSRRWPCELQYVGGTERTKNNAGVVIAGREQVIHFARPWEVLGWEAAEHAVNLYRSGNLAAAESVLQGAMAGVEQPALCKAMDTLRALIQGVLEWDRFEHESARQNLRRTAREIHALEPLLSSGCIERLTEELPRLITWLAGMPSNQMGRRASFELVEDLMGNAARRMEERRFDDATARYYRALEATAQWRLATAWGIESTGAVPVARIPGALEQLWGATGDERTRTLGLQDAFRLLAALEDDYGKRFHQAGLAGNCEGWMSAEWGRQTLLTQRNLSILAHGFSPIGEKTAMLIRSAAEKVTGISTERVMARPRLEVA